MNDDWFLKHANLLASEHIKTANKFNIQLNFSPVSTVMTNNHNCWMYNNVKGALRSSWLDVYSWTVGKLNDTIETTNFDDFINILDNTLIELSKLGTFGFMYSMSRYYGLLVSRCKILKLNYKSYYLPLSVFDRAIGVPGNFKILMPEEYKKAELPKKVIVLPTVTDDEFINYIKNWSSVTLSRAINRAYMSYISDQHDGPFILPNPPKLTNVNAVRTHFTGPPCWVISLDENYWTPFRWGMYKGKNVINPFMWSPEIIRAWLTLPEVSNVILNYKQEGIPIISANDAIISKLPKHVTLYQNGNTNVIEVNIRNWKKIITDNINSLTGDHHMAFCSWPLHRLTTQLGMPVYNPIVEVMTKMYGTT